MDKGTIRFLFSALRGLGRILRTKKYSIRHLLGLLIGSPRIAYRLSGSTSREQPSKSPETLNFSS